MIYAAILSFISILLGGLTSIRFKDKLHIILGLTAGIIIGLIAFDVLPEIFNLVGENSLDINTPMLALIVGLMLIHVAEKSLLLHHSHEENYSDHKHPAVGIFSALAFILHSFLDGIGIGISFQISTATGILVTTAVVSHNFADGLNSSSLMLLNNNTVKKTYFMIILHALAPAAGVILTMFFVFSINFLVIYLGFFTGILLYLALADILPEAHSKDSSYKTILMTILGIVFMYLVTQYI